MRLQITELLTPEYKKDLFHEADGHPYVIKILLGEVARERRAVTPKRIVATSELLLKALFERTYNALSPAGQRVFLLLCRWKVFVPEIAVEAVSLRPGTTRFDVTGALEELHQFSLVDRILSKEDDVAFVGVPLAAAMYGLSKLEVSPLKVSVEADRKLLMEFGPGRGRDVVQGVFPRVENFIRAVALRAGNSPSALTEELPVLEYLATTVPRAYLKLADLVLEVGVPGDAIEQAKGYVRNYLESADIPDRKEGWMRLADLCQRSQDPIGEIHAISEVVLLPALDVDTLGSLANRLNMRLRDLKERSIEHAGSGEMRELLEPVITIMEKRSNDLSGTNCSRLAWLHLNVGNSGRAREVAEMGIDREPANEHCRKIVERLDS